MLTVSACATGDGSFDISGRACLVAVDRQGHEHVAVRSPNGAVRLDVVSGSVLAGPVALRVHLDVTGTIPPRLSALDRLLRLLTIRDPGRRSQGADPRLARLVEALRVADALADGASLSRIAATLRDVQQGHDDWPGAGDNIKSSVRRRVSLARRLTEGGPNAIMHHEV